MPDDNAAESDASVAPAADLHRVALWVKLLGWLAALTTAAIYFLRLDQVVGWMMDDAWYVLLAQSLATGQGYRLINAPTSDIFPLYPPGFPWLLSLVYRLNPHFPENLWMLKTLSILAVLASGFLLYRYFFRQRRLPAPLALGIAVATCLCPPLVFLATSTVMSDCVFMLLLVAGIVLTERLVVTEVRQRGWLLVVALGAIAGLAFLTRSIGVALVIAIFLYLLKERMLPYALAFALMAAIVIVPWMLYSRAHAPTYQQQMEQGGYIVQPYSMQFWQKLAGDRYAGEITASQLPQRVLTNSLEFLGRDVCRILMAVVFEAVRDPFKDAEKVNASEAGTHGEILPISVILGIIVLIGFYFAARERITVAEIATPLTAAVIVLWPFETVRYALPLTPFVIFYFLLGIRGLVRWLRSADEKLQWRVVYSAVLFVVAINLFGNIRYLLNLNETAVYDRPLWVTRFEEAEQLFKQIKEQVPANEAVGTTIPALVHLYTGRKTVAWEDPAGKWEMWKKLGVKHYAWLLFYPRPPEPAERQFKTTFVSKGGGNFRLIDLGPPENRASWATP
jgi:hypothetical protein